MILTALSGLTTLVWLAWTKTPTVYRSRTYKLPAVYSVRGSTNDHLDFGYLHANVISHGAWHYADDREHCVRLRADDPLHRACLYAEDPLHCVWL